MAEDSGQHSLARCARVSHHCLPGKGAALNELQSTVPELPASQGSGLSPSLQFVPSSAHCRNRRIQGTREAVHAGSAFDVLRPRVSVFCYG